MIDFVEKKIPEVVDPVTGEVLFDSYDIMTREDVPFRSITDLKGFSDVELNFDPSETDSSQYEPLESLISRMMRGEIIPGNGFDDFDVRSDTEDPWSTEDITQTDGFDLADVQPILDKVRQKPAQKEVDKQATPVQLDIEQAISDQNNAQERESAAANSKASG